MNASELADWIVILAAVMYLGHLLGDILSDLIEQVSVVRARNRRIRDGKRFAAARRAAREECEARMRTEGYWDNYEIQDAMEAAGQRAVPGFRP